MRISTVAACLLAWSLCAVRPAAAQDNAVETIFRDALYGGLAGALIGGAVLAFTDNPGDHLDYIGVGAAVGVIGGAAFGFAQATRAFAEIDDGTVHVSVPSVQTSVSSGGPGHPIVERRIDFLRFRF